MIGYCPLYDTEDFGSVLAPDGRPVTVFTDVDRLEAELLSASRPTRGPCASSCGRCGPAPRLDIPFRPRMERRALTRLRTAAASLRACRRCSSTVASPCASSRGGPRPLLLQVFDNLVHFGGPDVPCSRSCCRSPTPTAMPGDPLAGWLSFSRAVERRFIELGGEMRYRAKVALETERRRGPASAWPGTRSSPPTGSSRPRTDGSPGLSFSGRTTVLARPPPPLGSAGQANLASPGPARVRRRHLPAPRAPSAPGGRQSRLTVKHQSLHPDAAPPGKNSLTVFLESGSTSGRSSPRTGPPTKRGRAAAPTSRSPPRAASARHCRRVEVIDVSTPSPASATPATGGAPCRRAPGREYGQVAPAGRSALRRPGLTVLLGRPVGGELGRHHDRRAVGAQRGARALQEGRRALRVLSAGGAVARSGEELEAPLLHGSGRHVGEIATPAAVMEL